MPTTHEISAVIVSRWDELSRDGVINREETIRQIIQEMLDSSARCVYCNSVFNLTTPEGKEAIVKHVMSCDQNPMTEIYQEAKKIVEADTKAKEASDAYIALLEKNNAELEARLPKL